MSRVFYHVCALKGICQFRGSLSTAPLTVSMKVREKASQVHNRLFKSKGAASQCPRFPDRRPNDDLFTRRQLRQDRPRQSREGARKLLDDAKRSRSPALLPLLILSLDRGLRASEVRSLRRRDLKLEWRDGLIRRGKSTFFRKLLE